MNTLVFTTVMVCTTAASAAVPQVTIFPGSGYRLEAYASLKRKVSTKLVPAAGATEIEVCIAHGVDGAAAAAASATAGSPARCNGGVVLLAANPPRVQAAACPVLVLAAELDGLHRISAFAAARHQAKYAQHPAKFGVVLGASHHSFAASPDQDHQQQLPERVALLDLKPTVPYETALDTIAAIVANFVAAPENPLLHDAEKNAERLSAPIIAALELEGSAALGHPSCNSDYPSNPSCNYTPWPAHSLPPGPAPAPSPPLPADCVCGSPWVQEYANPMVSSVGTAVPGATVETKDSFHDVADVHPFHLPHIFNSCNSGGGGGDSSNSSSAGLAGGARCVLNVSTVTMPIIKPGALFPNGSSAPLSAFELRTKLKSRTAAWEAAGVPAKDTKNIDNNLTMCSAVNNAAYQWALSNADPAVRARFETNGEPFVIVDDMVAKIGIHGPEWIQDELVYTRVPAAAAAAVGVGGVGGGVGGSSRSIGGDGSGDRNGTVVTVQSWQFVVPNTNTGKVPWFFPVGMHYCKLLSPARAMEWIYTDGLRQRCGAGSSEPCQ